MGFCSEEILEDIALTLEAHKPKYKTPLPTNGVSKPSEQAAINLILRKTYRSTVLQKQHQVAHNVLLQHGFVAIDSMKQCLVVKSGNC
jgi:hypothetical protein